MTDAVKADEIFMQIALDHAGYAASLGEVPVGCVVVKEGEVVGIGYNRREIDHNPLAHAEVAAIYEASRKLGVWRLSDCDLYVTLEPCVMCAGAIVLSRIRRLVYGATDRKAGAVASLYEICSDLRLNHRPEVVSGVMAEQCGTILTEFFAARRAARKNEGS